MVSSNGNIDANQVSGSVDANTSNGSITIKKTDSIKQVHTSNGNINIELNNLDEDVMLKTSNGGIYIVCGPKLNAEINANTSNSRIAMKDIELKTKYLNDNSLNGTIGKGGARIDAYTSNGKIEISSMQYWEEK